MNEQYHDGHINSEECWCEPEVTHLFQDGLKEPVRTYIRHNEE